MRRKREKERASNANSQSVAMKYVVRVYGMCRGVAVAVADDVVLCVCDMFTGACEQLLT